MKYGCIKGIDKPVSRLVFGTATGKINAASAPGAGKAAWEEAFTLLDQALAAGINTFDCAAVYGEAVLGRWMAERGVRDQCVVITKCAHPNAWRDRVTDYDILSDAHDSLAKLQTDKIDLYLLHRDDHNTPVSTVIDVMNRLYEEGKIRAFGASNWTHRRMEEANNYALRNGLLPFAAASPNFGLAEQVADPWQGSDGCVSISGPQNGVAREWYARSGMPVFAYSCMARGLFSGAVSSEEPEKLKMRMDAPGVRGYFSRENLERLHRCEVLAAQTGYTVAQIAMAWLYGQKLDVYAVSSPSAQAHILASVEAQSIALTTAQCSWLNLEAESYL